MTGRQAYPSVLDKHGIVAALSATKPLTPAQLAASLAADDWPVDGKPVTADIEGWVWA